MRRISNLLCYTGLLLLAVGFATYLFATPILVNIAGPTENQLAEGYPITNAWVDRAGTVGLITWFFGVVLIAAGISSRFASKRRSISN